MSSFNRLRATSAALVAAGVLGLSCYTPDPFGCDDDAMCRDGARMGRCEVAAGSCSYASDDCESGREFGPFSGELEGTCTAAPYESVASFATCVGEGQPVEGQGSCAVINGIDRLDVDVNDSDIGLPNTALLIFELTDELRDRGPSQVTLVLTVAGDDEAVSDTSGSLWRVEPFTLQSLSSGLPERIFPMLGADQGRVDVGQMVQWTFELDLAQLPGDLHLAVVPTGPDNVQYWNLLGVVPPRIRIGSDLP